jgi:hypothetical protein
VHHLPSHTKQRLQKVAGPGRIGAADNVQPHHFAKLPTRPARRCDRRRGADHYTRELNFCSYLERADALLASATKKA